MSYSCNQCDAVFDSNCALYTHKTSEHGPSIGIVVGGDANHHGGDGELLGGKRKRDSQGSNPSKYRKVYESDEEILGGKRKRDDQEVNPSKYRKVYESDDGELLGGKRKRDSQDSNPSKYRKVYDSDETSRGLKRRRRLQGANPSKFRKVYESDEEVTGVKRKRDNQGIHPSKYRKIYNERRGKRKRRNRLSRGKPTKIRRTYESSSDDETDGSDESYKNYDECDDLRKEISTLKRQKLLLENKNREFEDDIRRYIAQIDELEASQDDYELSQISNLVVNDVNIREFNKIRELMEQQDITAILRSSKHVSALKKLFIGLSWGIIPITAPQKINLTDGEKSLISRLKNASIGEIRQHIKNNRAVFANLFKIINDSIQFVVNSYHRFS